MRSDTRHVPSRVVVLSRRYDNAASLVQLLEAAGAHVTDTCADVQTARALVSASLVDVVVVNIRSRQPLLRALSQLLASSTVRKSPHVASPLTSDLVDALTWREEQVLRLIVADVGANHVASLLTTDVETAGALLEAIRGKLSP